MGQGMKKVPVKLGVKERLFVLMTLILFNYNMLHAPNVVGAGDKKIDYAAVLNWLNNARPNNVLPTKIEKYEDIVTLFDNSLQLIFEELCLEECPMENAYSDGWKGDTTVNTLGIGSTYALENIDDYNNPDAVWLRVKDYPEVFADKTYSYEDMLKLVVGWAKYLKNVKDSKTGEIISAERTNLESMFDKLCGASLTPNEFSAVFARVYNGSNINKFCPFIRENYNDPFKCANEIMNWSEAPGFVSRSINEALVYLDADNYCNDVKEMRFSKGGSCIYGVGVEKQELTPENYVEYSNNCKDKFLAVKNGFRIKYTEQGLNKYFQPQNKVKAKKSIYFAYPRIENGNR